MLPQLYSMLIWTQELTIYFWFVFPTNTSHILSESAVGLQQSNPLSWGAKWKTIFDKRQGWREFKYSHRFQSKLCMVHSTNQNGYLRFVCFVTIVNGLKNPTQCTLHYNKLRALFGASNMHTYCVKRTRSIWHVSNSPRMRIYIRYVRLYHVNAFNV